MTDLISHVALVPYTNGIVRSDELSVVAAALQQQITRDVGPIWNLDATVDAFPTLDEVPLGYWPILIGDQNLPEGEMGVHVDEHNQPYALVRFEENLGWSLTASHEAIEMLVDPYGSRFIAGKAPVQGAQKSSEQGRVLILVEACDPCEAPEYAYTVNNVLVSDFYTPHFFDPETTPGVLYDYRGKISAPRTVLPGGYITWRNPQNNHYFQVRYTGRQPELVDLGTLEGRRNIREAVDHHPGTPREIYSGKLSSDKQVLNAHTEWTHTQNRKANWTRELLEEIRRGSEPIGTAKRR